MLSRTRISNIQCLFLVLEGQQVGVHCQQDTSNFLINTIISCSNVHPFEKVDLKVSYDSGVLTLITAFVNENLQLCLNEASNILRVSNETNRIDFGGNEWVRLWRVRYFISALKLNRSALIRRKLMTQKGHFTGQQSVVVMNGAEPSTPKRFFVASCLIIDSIPEYRWRVVFLVCVSILGPSIRLSPRRLVTQIGPSVKNPRISMRKKVHAANDVMKTQNTDA